MSNKLEALSRLNFEKWMEGDYSPDRSPGATRAGEDAFKSVMWHIYSSAQLPLLVALDKSQHANAAQADHINQQQDRIDTLEKRNDELGKHAGKLEQRLALVREQRDNELRTNAELEQRLGPPALADVMAERQRQISAEGWTPEHDDEHDNNELAFAAGCYAIYAGAAKTRFPNGEYAPPEWPWNASFWKPSTVRRDLVKAGALILAEIERLDRAAAKVEGE